MSSVTDAELNAAAQKLIEEANAESEAALAEYERDCLSARFRLLERGTYRSSILQDSLNELRAAYDKLVLRIQRELDESLEALYAEAEEPDDGEDPGGDGEDPGGDGEDPGGDGEDLGGDGEDPGGDGEDPGGDGEDPGGDGEDPGGDGEDPGGDGEDPGGDGEDPGGDGEDPGGDGEDPGGDGEDPDEPEAPYEVDESLPMRDRYIAVKNYYLSIPNAADALEALRDDSVAKEYLGTYYNYLEQLLIMMQ